MELNLEEQLAYLTKGCVDVVPVEELKKKLEKSNSTGRAMTLVMDVTNDE